MSRLIYVIAFTPSFERMRQFYENSLDLEVKNQMKGWVEYDTGGARFALLSIGPEKRGIQLRFEAKDIERECAAMTKRGVRFEHEVSGVEDVCFHARQGLHPGQRFGEIEVVAAGS